MRECPFCRKHTPASSINCDHCYQAMPPLPGQLDATAVAGAVSVAPPTQPAATSAYSPLVLPPPRTYRVKWLGVSVVIALTLVVGLTLLMALYPLIGDGLVTDAFDGKAVDQAALDRVYLAYGLAQLLPYAAQLLVFVPLVIWMWRARKNLDALPAAWPSLGAGWAIGGWFVPIAALFIVGRMMFQIVKFSVSSVMARVLVFVWLLSWIAYNVADVMLPLSPGVSGVATAQEHLDFFPAQLPLSLAVLFLAAISAYSLGVLLIWVGKAQEEAIDQGAIPAPVVAQPIGAGGTIGV